MAAVCFFLLWLMSCLCLMEVLFVEWPVLVLVV